MGLGLFLAAAIISACTNNSSPQAPVRGIGVATPTPSGGGPTPPPVSGAQAACVVTLGGTTYAFVPGLISSGTNAGKVGLAEVTLSTGSGIASRIRGPIASAHLAPNVQLPRPQAATTSSRLRALDTGAGGSPILALTPAPQECAADTANGDLYLISYASAVVNVVHVDPSTKAMSLLATYTSDATGSIGFSGGAATIVGEAWDAKDGGLIIATPTTYELYSGARASTPNSKIETIATINPSENFGYNPVTDQIWSPSYLGATNAVLIDVASKTPYALSPLPSSYSEPDQGAVDATTNIAVAPEEFSYTLYMVPLNQNVLGSTTFTNPNVVTATMTTL
ncbi:MAG TPA: hypothetical protein VKG44_04640, partial [Candidatus Baltobacteraceae bacterium]|nr:hypothetical protein [Candidatus Baltobacteraceae bacterium]